MGYRKLGALAVLLGASSLVVSGCGMSGSDQSGSSNGGNAGSTDMSAQIEQVSEYVCTGR